LRIASKVDVLEVFPSQRRQHGDEIIDAGKRKPEGTAGEMRVAAALLERRSFEHRHARAVFVRRDRGAQCGVAGPDHEHVRCIDWYDAIQCDGRLGSFEWLDPLKTFVDVTVPAGKAGGFWASCLTIGSSNERVQSHTENDLG
jgi:hypothetical protein